jgi:hypothetical protein
MQRLYGTRPGVPRGILRFPMTPIYSSAIKKEIKIRIKIKIMRENGTAEKYRRPCE